MAQAQKKITSVKERGIPFRELSVGDFFRVILENQKPGFLVFVKAGETDAKISEAPAPQQKFLGKNEYVQYSTRVVQVQVPV